MPIKQTDKGWYWGSKGPFSTKAQAQNVAKAAHASGFKEEAIMNGNLIGEFIGSLFHSATIAHIMHLQAKSYADHKALGKYYEEIVDLADSVAEAYQGCTGTLISDYPSIYSTPSASPLDYLKTLREYVLNNRQAISEYSNIQNEIDNVVTLLDSTIYKLTFLK